MRPPLDLPRGETRRKRTARRRDDALPRLPRRPPPRLRPNRRSAPFQATTSLHNRVGRDTPGTNRCDREPRHVTGGLTTTACGERSVRDRECGSLAPCRNRVRTIRLTHAGRVAGRGQRRRRTQDRRVCIFPPTGARPPGGACPQPGLDKTEDCLRPPRDQRNARD